MTTQPKKTPNTPEMTTLPSEDSLTEVDLAHTQSRETRPLPAVDLAATATVPDAAETTSQDTAKHAPAPDVATPAPRLANNAEALPDVDGDATIMRPAVRPELDATTIRPIIEPRPRKNTLANAFTPPIARARGEATPPPPMPQLPAAVPDEIDDEVDEWAAADQPTVYLAPRPLPQSQPRPAYLETG